ncbi:hypothetical protein CCYA_CCYA19G4710 [Cyanidiococcus yangmingshanensis]|nr:hypothetical protein CCYA_CCYA19G4710 [Cyanidiococcus yangmingshanensis]
MLDGTAFKIPRFLFRTAKSIFRSVPELPLRGASLLKFAAALYMFQRNVGELMICIGPSMLPTLSADGDVVILEHLTPQLREVERADVIVAVSPQNPRMSVCKRVIALSGEKVSVSNKTADRIEESHPELVRRGSLVSSIAIPQGHVWLEGDNPANSTDSRQYGPVPVSLIRGRVLYRILPLENAGHIAPPPADLGKASSTT